MGSFASLDLPEVLNQLGISHRRSGRELLARCPFHAERTPSWSIRADGGGRHGLWRCKGACEAPDDRGSVLTLIARVVGLRREDGSPDLSAARLWLSGGKDGPGELPLPPASVALEVNEGPPRGYRLPAGVLCLPASEWSQLPLRYLVEDRGVSAGQVDWWGLGYAFTGKLAGRIVLPARDASGTPRSHSARTFVGDRLKWRSADRHDAPDPDALFGEQHWPASGRESVVLVEAALDALAAEGATDGRVPVAAVHGSEPTDGQLAKLGTFREVLVASDPDEAGEKVHQAVRASLSRWTRVRRVRLPEGLDCSALWRRDPGALRRLLAP